MDKQRQLFNDMYDDVLAFHEKFGCHIENKPKVPSPEIADLRKTLIEEEFQEVKDAMRSENLADIAKELSDLVYVVLGTAISYGIDLRPVWEEVHKSNMNKARGHNRADGKITKPEGWKYPDIANLIKKQMGL